MPGRRGRALDGERLDIAVAGETTATILLDRPLAVATPRRPVTSTELGLVVDDPRASAAQVRARLAVVRDAPERTLS